MMSEMVERVAREMFNDAEGNSDQWGWDQHPPRDWDVDKIEDCEREAYRRQARTAIAAMREPTSEMIQAGGNAMLRTTRPLNNSIDAWQAMIDAALADE